MRRYLAGSLLCLGLAACAGGGADLASPGLQTRPGPQSFQHPSADASLWPPGSGVSTPQTERPAAEIRQSTPRIVKASARLQCVPYARDLSTIQIRGDAWTWWAAAKGRYERGRQPRLGAVLVLKRRGNSRGHLAVVTRIVDDREIIVNHANWLNRGRIHLDTPIRDVSPNNDWSAVRVWYTPGKVLGKSTYPAYGFIYPPLRTASR